MQPRVVAAQIAGHVVNLADLRLPCNLRTHGCTEPECVACRALCTYLNPVAVAESLILQQDGALPDARDHDIQMAVVVEVGNGEAAADTPGLERGTTTGRDIAEFAADVFVQQILLFVGERRLIQLHVVYDMSIGDVYIEIAVVVEIVHLRSEP